MALDDQDLYIPTCDESIKPRKGKIFRTLNEGIEFYQNYARAVGFDTRLSSAKKVDDIYTWRYVVCSREGEKYVVNDGEGGTTTNNKRRRMSIRCGFKAKVVFKIEAPYGYLVHAFVEKHNHPMVEDQCKKLMKVNHNPDKYVPGRWQKLTMVQPVYESNFDDIQNHSRINENQMMRNKIMSSVFGWLHKIEGSVDKMVKFLSGMDDLGKCIMGEDASSSVVNEKLFQDFGGAPIIQKSKIFPPNIVNFKGSDSCLVLSKEKGIKPLRHCTKCKQMVHHDARNCDKLKAI